MVAYSNITISAPSGTSQHGVPELLCYPSTWKTVTLFFLINYVAHCFTTWRRPGEKTAEYLFHSFLALIFPVSGLGRGLEAIYRHASWPGSWKEFAKGTIGLGGVQFELQKAGKAGALCVVARDHRSRDKQSGPPLFKHNRKHWDLPKAFISGTLSGSPNELVKVVVGKERRGYSSKHLLDTREVSGAVILEAVSPYRIVELPASSAAHIRLEKQELREIDYESHKQANFVLAQSSNAFQILLAIAQIVYSSYTLAGRTGNQFQLFGYSAFSITIIPYITMSFINLLGNLLTPSYPCLYLIKTSVMDEAQSRGNLFQGHVASLDDNHLREQQALGNSHDDEENGNDISPLQPRYKVVPCNQPRAPAQPRASHPFLSLDNRESTLPVHDTNELQKLRICFCPRISGEARLCGEKPTSTINVLAGYPSTSGGTRRKLFFIVGWLIAIIAPLPPIIYHGITNSGRGSLFQKVTILLWIVIGDILGTVTLYLHPTLDIILSDFKMAIEFINALTKPEKFENLPEKTKEDVAQYWIAYLLLLFGIIIGLAVAGMNFHTVVIQILAFGDCMDMPS